MIKQEDIWIFLSHSNKDYEKVRLVRNMLEEHSMRPLMFFLHCLNDDEELDSLIKREIDCRTRFILCDSENARNSHWVQKEVEYILSQNRICETIDLEDSIDNIYNKLKSFIRQTKVFISYNREEYSTALQVYNRLSKYDLKAYLDNYWAPKEQNYQQDYFNDTLQFLLKAVEEGCIVSIMTKRILDPYSCARSEIIQAIDKAKELKLPIDRIFIPFVTEGSIIEEIKYDKAMLSLIDCDICNLENNSPNHYADAIIEKILTRLMTIGSIKVQADNFAKGIHVNEDKKEAQFLYNLIDKVDKGLFYLPS